MFKNTEEENELTPAFSIPPLSEQIMDVEGKQFNVMDFIKEYVKNMDCDEETKDKMVKSISKLYTVVTAQEQEQRIS